MIAKKPFLSLKYLFFMVLFVIGFSAGQAMGSCATHQPTCTYSVAGCYSTGACNIEFGLTAGLSTGIAVQGR